MKRIIIILLIAVCLISFMDMTYSAKEYYINYGEMWLKLSNGYRFLYITGFIGGMDLWGIKILPILTSKMRENLLTYEETEVIQKLLDFRNYFAGLVGDVDGFKNIINIVTDLYKDPANTYIPTYKMIEVAYQKLKGKDIEPLLREERKKALP